MPGFSFPTVGPLGLSAPPSRSRTSNPLDHRYYDQLRLPNARLGVVRSWLSFPDTLYRPSLRLSLPHFMQDSLRGGTFHPNAGILPKAGSPYTVCLPKEAFGPPKSPSYPHGCMPWSQTPVVSQAHRHSAPRTAAFRWMKSVDFPLTLHREIILVTTTASISGLNTQPASLIHPASYSHCWVGTWTSLLTCRLHFGQVGLEPLPTLTHWVTLSNFIPPFGNPNDLGLTWHDHPLI